jgi:hypothetical protein
MSRAAAVEDREYYTVDLVLTLGASCMAHDKATDLRCFRRAGHVSTTHRNGGVTWAVA